MCLPLKEQSYAACAFVSFGQLRAESFDITSPRADTALHGYAGARAQVESSPGEGLFAWASAEALLLLFPQRVVLNNAQVYALPRVGARLSLGGGLRFF